MALSFNAQQCITRYKPQEVYGLPKKKSTKPDPFIIIRAMSQNTLEKISHLITSKPRFFLVLASLVFALCTPGLIYFESQNDVRIWFKDSDPKIQVLNAFERQFGNDENLVIAVHHPDGLFSPKTMQALHEISERTWLLPQVLRVDSLTAYNITESFDDEILIEPFLDTNIQWDQDYLSIKKDIALNHPHLPGYLISEDAKTSLIFARLTPTLEGSPNYELIVDEARKLQDDFKDSGVEIYLSGEATMNNTFREISNLDAKKILPLLFLAIVLFLYLIFRSWTAVILPLAIIVMTVTSSLGLGFWLGFKFNSILGILPAILVAVSIADSVHVMLTYFQFRAQEQSLKDATFSSLEKNMIPVFLTSVTTMIGFFSLTTTDLVPIQTLGFLAGVGCLMAWFFTVFFLCPFLMVVEIKVPKHFYTLFADLNHGHPIAHGFTRFIHKASSPILIFFTILSFVCLAISSTNTINSNPLSYFSDEVPLKTANQFIQDNFGGSAGPEMMIDAGKADGIKDPAFLQKVDSYKQWLAEFDFVDKSIDIVDIVKDMNQALNGGDPAFYSIPQTQEEVAELLFLYTLSLPQGMDLNNRMSLDFSQMRMSVLWRVQTSSEWGEMVKIMEKKGEELGLNIMVTGKTNLFQSMMGYVVATFFKSIITASILVALLMMLLFRSVKIGLISLIPNIIPLLIGGAVMKLLGMNLNIGTTLVASVCLGIAVDDTIHFLSNFYRYQQLGSTADQAVQKIFTYTGSALMVTTGILVAGFGLFVLGDFTPNVNFGILCAVVLSSALVVDMLFLPALLLKMPKKN